MDTPVYLGIFTEGTRFRAAGRKRTQTKQTQKNTNKTNSAQEEINSQIKQMCGSLISAAYYQSWCRGLMISFLSS